MSLGPFYIEVDFFDPFKYVIREKKKIYGWLFNSFEYINHLEFSVVKTGPVPSYPVEFNHDYICVVPYSEVLDELLNEYGFEEIEIEIEDFYE